jgi:phage terminase small subunit
MKKNLTEQQEKFCKEYADGKSAVEAYKASYKASAKYNTINYQACKLLKNELIISRIKELKEKKSLSLNYTAEESASKIKQIQELAISKGDMTNALKAEEMLQKITGINKDNNALQIGIVGDFKEFYAAICAKKDYGSTKSINTQSKSEVSEICPESQIIENK